MYEGLKAGRDANYDFGESELNTLGYQLLYGDKKPDDAVAIFRLNTAEYPASSNAFDSLGEAYSQSGQKALAIQSYQTAVKLDPTNGHAVSMLKQLK
jgi:tetratricopeptide (TPR) repeat protein